MEGQLTLLRRRLRRPDSHTQAMVALPAEEILPRERSPRGSSAPPSFRTQPSVPFALPGGSGNAAAGSLAGGRVQAAQTAGVASDRFQPRRVVSSAPPRRRAVAQPVVGAGISREPSPASPGSPESGQPYVSTQSNGIAKPPLPVRRPSVTALRRGASSPVCDGPDSCCLIQDMSPPSSVGRGVQKDRNEAALANREAPMLPPGVPKWAHIAGHKVPAHIVSSILRYLPVSVVPIFRRINYCCHAVTATRLARDPALKSSVDILLEGRRLKSKRVWVVVRARPAPGVLSCMSFDRNRITIKGTSAADSSLFFDRAFPEQSTQCDVGEYICGKVLPHALIGEHICLLAYGQTGSGKTHTMFGNLQAGPEQGIAFLLVSKLAEHLRGRKTSGVAAEFSFLEVYNDELFDLLDGSKRLSKQRSSEKHVVPQGLTRRRCDLDDMEKQVHGWLREGASTRTVGRTVFNPRSSRSHGIVLLTLMWGANSSQASRIKSSVADSSAETRIYIVDLAGSERAGLYAISPEQLKEGEHINLSLSALGRVVSALAAGRCEHVPYRDSALTWLLKDAITGTSARVCMIAAVHPAHAQETAITLRYAKQYSALQASTNTQIPTLTQEVQKQQRITDNLKHALEQAMAGDEHSIPWTWETLEGTVQPTRNARELVEAHPQVTWTQAHQSKHLIRGNRRDRGAIGRIARTTHVPPPRAPTDQPDGRLVGSSSPVACDGLETLVEVIFEGKNGRPPLTLWYPESALEAVQPPKKLLDAMEQLKRAEELLAFKRGELQKAKEDRSKDQKAWMEQDD